MLKTSRVFLFGLLAQAALAIVATIAIVVLTGWALHIEALKSVLPGSATMKVNTALGFLICSVVLWAHRTAAPGVTTIRLARAGAVFVMLLGVLSLAEEILSIDLGIDQALLIDPGVTSSVHPGRMAPAAAFSFLGTGLALLAFKAKQPTLAALAHWLAVVPLFVATLTLVGYAYSVPALYQQRSYSSMAVYTAFCFSLLALSLFASDPTRGATRIAASDSAGGVVYRRLLPTILLILVAMGGLTMAGLRHGFYDIEFGLAMMVLLSIFICALAIASTANRLHQVDIVRKAAEDEIRTLNVALERRVRERTQALVDLSDSLSVANKSLKKLSLHDALTGLANRRFFDVHLGSQVTMTRRRHRVLALVLFDVDNFKSYNDFYGHQAGDECLRRIAAALRTSCARSADMAARYGGEEFALILPDTGIGGAENIAEIARRAVAYLKIPHAGSTVAPHVTISGGVAILTRESGLTAEQLIAAADINLFRAKSVGRNRIVSEVAKSRTPKTIAHPQARPASVSPADDRATIVQGEDIAR